MTVAEQLHNSATHAAGKDASCPVCNPELLPNPNWFEYARRFRTIRVAQRKVAIGHLYDAYMPAGFIVTEMDLETVRQIATDAECHTLEVVPA